MTLTIHTPTNPQPRSVVGRGGTWLRSVLRDRRADAPVNVVFLGALWFAYAAVRNLARDTRRVALSNASRLLDVESALGVDIERGLQSAVDWPHAYVAANTYYLVHFPLTLTVMVLAFRYRRSTVFPIMRNSLIGCTATALVVHLLVPMAPPRMLPGFIDAGTAFGPDPYAIAGSESANQFAAMPSMHVAWAILTGYAIGHLSGRRLASAVSVAHPVVTATVVVFTGHHFVTDVAIGAGLALVFLFLARHAAHRRHAAADPRWRRSHAPGPYGPFAPNVSTVVAHEDRAHVSLDGRSPDVHHRRAPFERPSASQQATIGGAPTQPLADD